MRIRKIKETRNEYISAGGVWVRNFAVPICNPMNESCMIYKEDHATIVKNEYANHALNLSNIAEENFHFTKVVIVSDGFNFEEKCQFLHNVSPKVCVIAVNRALKKWPLIDSQKSRPINLYVVNNPYEECLYYLPQRYFPACIASSRTHNEFLKRYSGVKYLYAPTPDKEFGFKKHEKYFIDDYRSPVCAAMGLAYRFGARQIMTLCCDDSFNQHKPMAEELENGLWAYPQQLRSSEIIDANAFWLKQVGIKVADYSSGPKTKHAEYIESDDKAKCFFEEG